MADPNRPRRSSGSAAAHPVLFVLAVVAVLVAVSAFLIGRDVLTWYRGMSIDFPYYVWRTNLVSATGLHSLAAPILSGTVVNPDRPGFPVVAALLGSAVRVDPVAIVRVVQVATTLAISLAAGAFAVDILDEPRWSLPLYALVMGVSAPVAWTSTKSLDNLLIDAVLLAVAVAAVGSVDSGRGRAAAAAGLAAATLIHWFFSVLFLLLLAGVAVLLIPWSISARRRGTPISRTPAVVMGITVAGGGLAAAAALFGLAPGLPVRLPPLRGSRVLGSHGNETRLPSFRLPFTGALAALGALSLWRPDTLKRRTGLVLLGLWGLSLVVALLASAFASNPIKIFRVAGFDLAIPMLCAAALVAVVRIGRRSDAVGLAAATVVVGAALFALASIGVSVYRTPESKATASRLEQVRSVAGYVEAIPPGQPVVFLSTLPDPRGAYRVVLAGLPGDRIGPTYLYVGSAQDLLAGGMGAQDGDARLAQVAAAWWREAWGSSAEILNADPVIIYLEAFNGVDTPPPSDAATLAPGVLVLHGPTVTSSATPAPLSTTVGAIALQVVGALLLLGLVGSGWTRWLLPVGPLGWAALSPAVGIGALALLGTAAGKVGGPSGGTGGLGVLISIAALGWLPLLARRRGWRTRPTGTGSEPGLAEAR